MNLCWVPSSQELTFFWDLGSYGLGFRVQGLGLYVNLCWVLLSRTYIILDSPLAALKISEVWALGVYRVYRGMYGFPRTM